MRRVMLLLCCLALLCTAVEMCWASPALRATTQVEAVRELSRTGGFSYPMSVSVDPSDGSCWVADMDNHEIVHLAPDGTTELSRAGGFYRPRSLCVNPGDGSCWVADTYNNQIVHLASDGVTELSRAGGFTCPASVSVNSSDGSCWVADRGSAQVVHLAGDGVTELSRADGFSCPSSVSVNPGDGSCWVAVRGWGQVVHLAADGTTELSRTGGFYGPQSVSVNPSDASCWVADFYDHQIVHLASDGVTELSRAGGFSYPMSVSVDPGDGSCWVADDYNSQVVHLAEDGVTELSRTGGFANPLSVSVNPSDGSCWVADTGNDEVVHLGWYWAAPAITGMSVERGRDTGSEGEVGYHEWVIVYVSDPDGLVDTLSVTVIDAQGQVHDAWLWNDQGTWGEFWWQSYGQAVAPPPGAYVAQVRDQAGQLTDEVLAQTSEIPEETPVILTPPAANSIVYGNPTFSWSAAEGVGCFCLGVHEVDGPCAIWCPSLTEGPATSPVEYNYNGTGQDLIPGHLYGWHVISHVPDPIEQSDPRAWALFAGIADGLFTTYSPDPVIQHVTICRSRWIDDYYGTDLYSERARIQVIDFDGWEDVSVTTTDPEGGVHPGPDDSCDGSWNEGLCILSQGWAQDRPEPLAEGVFTVLAEDSLGRTDGLETAAIAVPPPVQNITYPLNGDVIWETRPTFSWEPAEGAPAASGFCICVTDEAPEPFVVWFKPGMPGDATSVTYNDDDSAIDPELTPGHRYMVHLRAHYPDEDPSDRVSATSFTQRDIEFRVYSPEPMIEAIQLSRGRDISPEGTVSYHERLMAGVSDMDNDVVSVVVTDSQGNAHEAAFRSGTQWYNWRWAVYDEGDPSPPGAYTLTVTDQEGHSAVLSVQASAIPEETPVILTPPANYSIAPATPSFSWSGPGDVCYCLGVREVDGACALWCGGRYVTGSEGSALYNDDEGAAQPELTPGRLWEWFVAAGIPDPVEQSDPRVASEFNPMATGRFWVEPKFVGLLEPINNDGSSIFKLGSTVPVKFRLVNADGSYKSDAIATLEVAFMDTGIVGDYYEAVSTAAPDSGNGFRYDPTANQYILNLGTKGLSIGTWSLRVTANGMVMKEVLISLQ